MSTPQHATLTTGRCVRCGRLTVSDTLSKRGGWQTLYRPRCLAIGQRLAVPWRKSADEAFAAASDRLRALPLCKYTVRLPALSGVG